MKLLVLALALVAFSCLALAQPSKKNDEKTSPSEDVKTPPTKEKPAATKKIAKKEVKSEITKTVTKDKPIVSPKKIVKKEVNLEDMKLHNSKKELLVESEAESESSNNRQKKQANLQQHYCVPLPLDCSKCPCPSCVGGSGQNPSQYPGPQPNYQIPQQRYPGLQPQPFPITQLNQAYQQPQTNQGYPAPSQNQGYPAPPPNQGYQMQNPGNAYPVAVPVSNQGYPVPVPLENQPPQQQQQNLPSYDQSPYGGMIPVLISPEQPAQQPQQPVQPVYSQYPQYGQPQVQQQNSPYMPRQQNYPLPQSPSYSTGVRNNMVHCVPVGAVQAAGYPNMQQQDTPPEEASPNYMPVSIGFNEAPGGQPNSQLTPTPPKCPAGMVEAQFAVNPNGPLSSGQQQLCMVLPESQTTGILNSPSPSNEAQPEGARMMYTRFNQQQVPGEAMIDNRQGAFEARVYRDADEGNLQMPMQVSQGTGGVEMLDGEEEDLNQAAPLYNLQSEQYANTGNFGGPLSQETPEFKVHSQQQIQQTPNSFNNQQYQFATVPQQAPASDSTYRQESTKFNYPQPTLDSAQQPAPRFSASKSPKQESAQQPARFDPMSSANNKKGSRYSRDSKEEEAKTNIRGNGDIKKITELPGRKKTK